MRAALLILAILGCGLLGAWLLWAGLRAVFTALGGWKELARRYRAPQLPETWQWTGQTVKVGMVRYRHSMRVAALTDGLYLALSGLLPQPALRIPWTDLRTATPTTVYGRPFVRVGLGMPPSATVEFPTELYNAIYRAAPRL